MVTNVIGIAVTLFVPAVVWLTLTAGVSQLLRQEFRGTRFLLPLLGRSGASQESSAR